MDSPEPEEKPHFGVGYQSKFAYRKLKCGGISIDCHRLIPLIDTFSPLSTSFEAPILAGETLYPSVEHHVAAQLLRDVRRLEAVRHVPSQLSRVQLRRYLNQSLLGVQAAEIENWRRNRMYSALKAATELKFSQYPELKALLLQTDDAFLVEVMEPTEKGRIIQDVDWSFGRTLDELTTWMRDESISPLAMAFFTLHPTFKPGVVGSNMTGRLLMEMRSQCLNVKSDSDEETLECPACRLDFGGFPHGNGINNNDEIVILAGQTNPLTFEYPSAFAIDGRCYFNVEHFVKSKMLEEFGFNDLIESWLSDLDARKPNFFKKITDTLWDRRQNESITDESSRRLPPTSVLRQWSRTRGVEYYEAALMAKFAQNPHFVRALLATGDSLLVELRIGTAKSERCKLEMVEYGAFSSFGNFANSGDPASFVKWVEKWQLDASTLRNLFLALNVDKEKTAVSFLPGLAKNRLGLLLMNVRERFASGMAPPMVTIPSLHQFFADFLLQLLETDGGQKPRLKIRLHRVNSFIIRSSTEQDDHSPSAVARPISVDGRCNPLSCFYLAPFTAEGLSFPTLEHYRWWKFFEYHSKYLQCLPGFWDHIDGRQLRAVCEQWTNENMGLDGPALIERYRTEIEFDVLRNGALTKHSQNPHLLSLLFDGVSYGPIIAGESEGDASFGVGMNVGKMRKLLERCEIRPETSTLWWTSLKCVKPTTMGDNLYGLALMSARDELFAVYCDRAVANIPMAPSSKNFNEVTTEENFSIDDLHPDDLFIFDDDHAVLGLNSPVTIDERSYESIIDYVLNECFSTLGLEEPAIVELIEQLANCGSISQKLTRSRRFADDKGLRSRFDDWFKNDDVLASTLSKAAKARWTDDSVFTSVLASTGNSMLIVAISEEDKVEGAKDNNNLDADQSTNGLLTSGLTEEEFGAFLRDIRPQSTQILQFWTRCDAVRPGRLGTNLWAACLMVIRRRLLATGEFGDGTTTVERVQTLDSIFEKDPTKATSKSQAKKERSATKPSMDFQPSLQYFEHEFKPELDVEPLLTLPPMSDFIMARPKAQSEDTETVPELQPIVEALRRCPQLFDRIVSSSESLDELKQTGERLGEQMISMFGGCVPDLKAFKDEDMFNLGRIAACQFEPSQ